jgi:hypothetical protein
MARDYGEPEDLKPLLKNYTRLREFFYNLMYR